jgi:hypothetical protein
LVRVVELVPNDGDRFREQPAPRTLTSAVRVFDATPVLGESTWAALHDAQAWLVEHDPR